jgi:DNA polymerase V
MENYSCLCIDLKSFYASVECIERGLDPMTTNLVVADPERSDKTICLAITPAMKALGIHNRCRVFEIPKNVKYITAEPRMQKYIDYAAQIYGIYLQYISKEDIHVYSIDEAFFDVTRYLAHYKLNAKEMAVMLMSEVFKRTGIRAACGVGTNLYLAKIALDITAKHSPDFIGILDEASYQKTLWDHKPMMDFWRVGPGTARRLQEHGITTMGQVARADEEMLYEIFGIDAELLIDHAWGRESTTIADIKAFKPKTNCLTSGQVLMRDYSYKEGKLIVREMMDLLCLDLAEKGLVTASVSLYVGYSNALRAVPARGTASLSSASCSDTVLIGAITGLYEQIVDKSKPVRRINISCNHVTKEEESSQISFFDKKDEADQRDRELQKTVLGIKDKYGKDAVLKGMNFQEAATTRARNHQIGGHKSGK